MRFTHRAISFARIMTVFGLGWLTLSGCSTPTQYGLLGAGVSTVFGAYSPANEIEQIYYLGIFDPQEQVPPAVYRIRIHGQASVYSRTKFASGWVRADLVDSLGSSVNFDEESGRISIQRADSGTFPSLTTGRRLMLFGPEGFREAPKDHRLVIVMGASPDKFFAAIDESLGAVTEVISERRTADLDRLLFQALVEVRNERERIETVGRDVEGIESELAAREAVSQ